MWRRFRSDPVGRLRERLDRFGATTDHRAVLDSGAIRDAEAVIEFVTATPAHGPLPEPVAEGFFLLACLHWYRYQLLPPGEDADDLGQAVALTEFLLRFAPERVPPSLLAMLHTHRPPPDSGRVPGPRGPGGPASAPTGSDRGPGSAPGGRTSGLADGEAGALFLEAVMLMAAAENNRDYRGVDRAAALLRRAVDGTPAGEPERLHYLSALGRVHREQFQHLGRRSALTSAIEAHRESLESTSAGDPERAVRLFNLGNVLGDRYEIDGAPADLDEAIMLLRDAARVTGSGASVRAVALANLGQRLRDRWRLRGRPADLDDAVDSFAAARAAGDPRVAALHGTALAERFLRDRATADRDAAIEAYRSALTGFGGLEPELTGVARTSLATLLAERHETDGVPADLDAAIEAYRAAAGSRSAHGGLDPDEMRHAVGRLLVTRYERRRRIGDITEAVRLLREGVDAAGEPADRARWLAELGYALGRGHADLGGVSALRAARDALAEAESLLPRADPLRHQVLNNLGNTLRELSDLAGEPALLEAAAVALRAAVAAAAPDAAALPTYRSNLGLVLQALFTSTQDLATLTEAIEVLAQATGTAPPGHPDRLPALHNYGAALNRRVELALDGALPAGGQPADQIRAGAARDADAAVTALREAAELAEREAEPTEYVQTHATLALAHLLRHRLHDDPAGLNEAVRLLQWLGESQPLVGAQRHRIHTNLGSALLLRYRAFRDEADAAAMLVANRAAVDALPAEHPARTMCLSNLATALEAVATPVALAEATAALRAAAAVESAPSLLRARAASRYAKHAAAAGDLPAALDGYATAIELIDLVAWHGMDTDDQARLLGLFPGLASDAAAVAIAVDRPERAVELLEYGRGVLLTRAHDAGADLAALRAQSPRLADRLADLQAALDGFTALAPAGPGGRAEQRYDLAMRRRELLAEIRARPGFADFLRPPPFAALARAAVGGPVVLVNVAARRCDALVVADGQVTVVPLPGLTLAELVTRTAGFLTAIAVLTGAAGPVGPEPAAQRRRLAARTEVGQALDWLWRVVAAPVLDAAAPASAPTASSGAVPAAGVDWPRLWWCPTGLLTLLPVHAAGPLDGGDGVLDRVVPSYTASLRALARARRGVPARAEPVDSALLVGMPQTPGLADLPGVAQEEEIVRQHLPRVRSLLGPAATPAAVLAALPDQPVAHLSCHGTQDLRAPAWGHLALASGPLHVRDLWRPAGRPGALAVLSACETVRGGAALPDEALTLGTAFQLAGFRHVIGALWSISDALTVRLCADLYAGLAVPGGIAPDRAAVALHRSVRRLRAALPDRPDTWAGYAHLGP
ncbi:CHAT domain-containing tetratricopeptide repeat protein [Micromonospora cremea]|uniref:CHAT domain-containing protein n=1 Tax=Micromonospora cremea TaxID=709881 RepID=A0A1N5YHY3_9ACTN|nr:CHAT domain-containing protein [Micromonospora cremea]SIN08810.1 CHAT domain-containing protein [Micromonospora cremea]